MADTERTIVSSHVRRGREFVEYSDASKWTRKVDRTTAEPLSEWTEVDALALEDPQPSTLYLSVVARHQAENEPKHWAIFSHRPDAAGVGQGQVWQVTGDAEMMHSEHASNVDILSSRSLAWHQVLNTDISDSQLARVDRIARAEPAPQAPNRAAVTENCQGWVMRVLWRIVDEGIVEQRQVSMLQRRMDPL